ncbi:glycosyltransferase [Hyphomicrobium denitrificans 1NES1]|uniref:Glycosyltransferase n=1 Tax=Hyphomicrobium denitrificans 1NES1 TaxID=670307 RepID=N0B0E7_9HYPH|nr:glycosyltransferase family 29 protein [Hyphomicrobium denitrificans]AGK56373.1 glycosyltransferase [Hyphomicrobium denitrificans 1NES1]
MLRIIRQYISDLDCRRKHPELYDDVLQAKRMEHCIKAFSHKTVAIVGNADSIFEHSSGKVIDGADVVVRINRGAPSNFTAQGRRTDILCLAMPMERASISEMFGNPSIIFVSPRRAILSSDLMGSVAVLPLQNWKVVSLLLDGCRPSAGMIATWIAHYLLQATSVSLYGFDWKKTKTHYADKMRRKHHNWALEEALMTRWAKEGWLELPPVSNRLRLP